MFVIIQFSVVNYFKIKQCLFKLINCARCTFQIWMLHEMFIKRISYLHYVIASGGRDTTREYSIGAGEELLSCKHFIT